MDFFKKACYLKWTDKTLKFKIQFLYQKSENSKEEAMKKLFVILLSCLFVFSISVPMALADTAPAKTPAEIEKCDCDKDGKCDEADKDYCDCDKDGDCDKEDQELDCGCGAFVPGGGAALGAAGAGGAAAVAATTATTAAVTGGLATTALVGAAAAAAVIGGAAITGGNDNPAPAAHAHSH